MVQKYNIGQLKFAPGLGMGQYDKYVHQEAANAKPFGIRYSIF